MFKAVFYFETGKGYDAAQSTVIDPKLADDGTGFTYWITRIPENCRGIRFKPEMESGTAVVVDHICADGEELSAFSESGELLGSSFSLFDDERWCIIPLDRRYRSLKIVASSIGTDLDKLQYSRLMIERNNYLSLAKKYESHYSKLQNLYDENKNLLQELQELKRANESLSLQMKQTWAEKMDLQFELNDMIEKYEHLETSFITITNSKFWRFTYPLRKLLNIIKTWCQRKNNTFSVVPEQDDIDPFLQEEKTAEMLKRADRIDIVATKHTLFVAALLQKALMKYNIESNILSAEPDSYLDIPYIFVAPLFIKKFPELYIVYQLEQTVNKRWLSERYLSILKKAYAVFDYSLINIDYFYQYQEIKNNLYYMPIDIDRELLVQHPITKDKSHDVLFYGDVNNNRRSAILKELRKRFDVSIRSNLFGEELYSSICDCKVVVNIHYTENALLETTRLYETLSLGNCVIVSERSRDLEEDNRLNDIIDFVDIGDLEALVGRISYWISHDDERENRIRKTKEFFLRKSSALEFYFGRFLLANDRTDFETFYNKENSYINFSNNRVCLNLPESVDRRKDFLKDNIYGFEFFPGLKYRLAWVGCAMSYKFIFRKALDQNLEQLMICEDDVFFPPDFSVRFKSILSFLENNSDWDIYSGIIADLGDVKIKKVEEKNGEQFVYLNRIVSMVFNIYNKKVFGILSAWDEKNRDVISNTIDRYLENAELNCVTNYPFLVGHKENLESTIWKSPNTVYNGVIARSNNKLKELIALKNG